MGVAKAVILTYDTSGNITYRKAINNILSAKISKDGERAVDSATIQLPANVSTGSGNPPSVGNGLYYIQDIADTTFLSGIWNMHYNILDESGNDLDGTSTNDIPANLSTLYVADSGTRFTGHIVRTFASTGDEIVISDPASRSHDQLTGPLLSFASIFDFYVWVQCSDTSSAPKYILDREDNTSGIAVYITGGATGVIKVDKWVSTTQSTMVTGSVQINDGNWHLIRVNRDGSNNVNLYVDNAADGTPASYSTSLQNTTPSFIIGNNSASAGTRRPFIGNMFQARFYTGGILTSTDATTIFNYKPQPYTMKFGGTVWQVTNNVDNKQLQCQGFSQILGNINLRPTGGSDTPASYNNVYPNASITSATPKNILSDIVTNWFPGWKLIWIPSDGASFGTYSTSTPVVGYVATGSLLQNMIALLYTVADNITFWTNSRKVLYVETLGYDRTDAGAFDKGSLTFIGTQQGGRYDITENGTDTSVYVNDLTFRGMNTTLTDTYSFAVTTNNQAKFNTRYAPINGVDAYVNGVKVTVSSFLSNPPDSSNKNVTLQSQVNTSALFPLPSVSVGTTGGKTYTYRIGYDMTTSGSNQPSLVETVVSSPKVISNGPVTASLNNTISGWNTTQGVFSYDILCDDDASLGVTVNAGTGTTYVYTIVPKVTINSNAQQMGASISVTKSGGSTPNNTLNWVAVRGATSYDVIVNRAGAGNQLLTNTTSTNYTDTTGSGSAYTITQTATAIIGSVYATDQTPYSFLDNNPSMSYSATLLSAFPMLTMIYQYDPTTTSPLQAPYGKIQDPDAITAFGDYSKIINLSGFNNVTNGQSFAGNYFLRYSNNIPPHRTGVTVTWSGSIGSLSSADTSPRLEQHITINAGSLVNCIRENMKVGVVAGIQGTTYSSTFGSATSSSYSPVAQIIKSFTYTFPQGQTSIVVGDFIYDMYDTNVSQASSINQSLQTISQVKNV